MFKTTVNDVEYRFTFHHLDFSKADLFVDMLHIPATQCKICSHRTICYLSYIVNKDSSDTYIHLGVTYCSKKDIFNKSTGRKKAMAKAFEKSDIDKETRKLIWAEYFKWCKQ